jgi:hypothetical protein
VLRSGALALLFLAGCAGEPMVEKVQPPPVPGIGVVHSIESAPEVAAAGGTAGSSTKRIGVRMADNSVQYFYSRATGLTEGERVEITADSQLRHPLP